MRCGAWDTTSSIWICANSCRNTPWVYRITWRVGGHIWSPWILRALPQSVAELDYDLCYVDSGEWVTPRVIATLEEAMRRRS